MNVLALLAGYSAMIAGLCCLAVRPLLSVIATLCGLALSISAATDLMQR